MRFASSLTDALDVKDVYRWGHSTRVSSYAMAIARTLANGAIPRADRNVQRSTRLQVVA
jgi:HD-GYP domain-containing protein (c-di-GMP phosphodiesterase class II)